MLRRSFLKILGITPIVAKLLPIAPAVSAKHSNMTRAMHSTVSGGFNISQYDYFDDASLFMDAKFAYDNSKTLEILQQRKMFA